jgi:hypothetical protein
MRFKCFDNSKKLIEFAHKFIIDERLPSLQKDVNACLKEHCPFPALLYCFSTIDLLGAVYPGFAAESSNTRGNFKQYACKFMENGNQRPKHEKYSNECVDLIQDIFRHKIVHLAQPRIVIKNKDRLIVWRYEYPESLNHLKLEYIGKKRRVIRNLTPYAIFYDHIFTISITQFVSDIIESVSRDRDGYLATLDSGYKNMQPNFDTAIKEIYS